MAHVSDEWPRTLLWTIGLVRNSGSNGQECISLTRFWINRFNVLHAEKLPSAIERYSKEVKRVVGVLEGCLEGKQWLVGDKCTFADLSFVTWNDRLDALFAVPAEHKFDGFPNVKAWHERMTSRPSWKTAMERRAVCMDEQGLMWNGMPKGINTHEEYMEKMKRDAQAKLEAEGNYLKNFQWVNGIE